MYIPEGQELKKGNMKRYIKLFITVLLYIPFATGQSQQIVHDDLYTLVAGLRSAMPGMNSEGFITPSFYEMERFRDVISSILDSNYTAADSMAQQLQYRLYEWYDTGNNDRRYYVLKEPAAENDGGVVLGWGTFIFHPEGEEQVIIEVPHPYWDTNTWRVGFKAYQRLRSRFFLMAGTHRYANGQSPAPADVAHNTQNMFHVVHQKLSPCSAHALQVHGFSRSGHPGYPDVVLSNGSSVPPAVIDSLAQAIGAQGFSTGIYDGINWSDLGATTNTQGQYSRNNGYSFIHMELEYFIRTSSVEWNKINTALAETFLTPLSLRRPELFPKDFQLYLKAAPNPFNPQVSLFFNLNDPGKVQLKIFDLNGKPVRVLLDGNTPAGNYRVQWRGKNDHGNSVAAGIYFAVLTSEKDRRVTRVLYIK